MRILLKFYIIISDSYDASQIRISGQFSYEKSSQRELQFLPEIRELPLHNRIWKEDESKLMASLTDFFSCDSSSISRVACNSLLPPFCYVCPQRVS